jgi:hypothetical protein
VFGVCAKRLRFSMGSTAGVIPVSDRGDLYGLRGRRFDLIHLIGSQLGRVCKRYAPVALCPSEGS